MAAVSMRPAFGEKMQRLLLKLVIKAAKQDKEGVYAVAQELVKIFEEGLEGESAGP